MDKNKTIRYAGLEDINTIGFLAHEIWPRTYGDILSPDQLEYMLHMLYSPESLQDQMENKQHSFLLVEDLDDEPVAFASFSPIEIPGVYKLHKIYVLASQQGQGLGKSIIDFVIHEINADGAKALRLNVNRNNKARIFYERLGFKVIYEEDIDIGNGYFMNDFIMELELKAD